ncbi:4-hydroxy-tetrahydrodipicolinate reductase [Alpinimonas psychrophila]|uniref:4-hydroxy-tetrahydrodipicolinate reductase n=1 Tax=Alpinimonas psychrophila TaxID=748908 RepID=A0A7W3PP01_9MICO|nr:4-hydroxy-tetrahydrodipicolinate reductase [Alpinimonas psychrophila]
MSISVAVVGASGKLGSLVCRLISASEDFHVAAELGSSSDLTEALVADVIVDVSLPSISRKVLELALAHEKSILIGTSGWSAERIASVEPLIAEHPEVGVIFISNFSIGSAVASHLAALAARHFDSIEIVETHGVHKVDSPSGTAVSTAERIAKARDSDVSAPHADQRARGQLVAGVPVHSLRMQGVIAQQEVIFGGVGETVRITHTTLSDRSYEAGIMAALRALPGLKGKLVGLDRVLKISERIA